MLFETRPIADIPPGAILAHSIKNGKTRFSKGHRLSADDIGVLGASGIGTTTVAILEDDDVHEDEAARILAEAVTGTGLRAGAPFTGRVNLSATADGLAVLNTAAINAFNQITEAITIATVPNLDVVAPKQLVATVKIIPFAVRRDLLQQALDCVQEMNAVSIAPFAAKSCALLQTTLEQTTDKILSKTEHVLQERLQSLQSRLVATQSCMHAVDAVQTALNTLHNSKPDIIFMIGASAITDRRDVLPSALEAAGGSVDHLGMPVDPGNLLMLGRIGETPVIGLPGCARSPKLNGFDWVLRRYCAGLPVTGSDIMAMGVGGLLKEIPSRPQPRTQRQQAPTAAGKPPKVTAIVLAAGQSKRMGQENKLLSPFKGRPMLSHVVDTLCASTVNDILVVTGHEHDRVEALFPAGPKVRCAHNPDYRRGMSTSLRRGIALVPQETDAALVCLGDMPEITAFVIDAVVGAYDRSAVRLIYIPTYRGQRGNPVLIDRRFFTELHDISGDIGARDLIRAYPGQVREVPVNDPAILRDIDTQEALTAIEDDSNR